MESLVSMAFGNIYRGKRVLVTGHTGFKGSWLCEWLLALGADVTGAPVAITAEWPKDLRVTVKYLRQFSGL